MDEKKEKSIFRLLPLNSNFACFSVTFALNDVEESLGSTIFDMIGPTTTVSVHYKLRKNYPLMKMLVSNALNCLIK